jgi:hypothetical protein
MPQCLRLRRLVVFLSLSLLVIAAAAHAAPGGHSVNATRCQKGAQKAM